MPRRSCQTALHHIVEAFTRWIAPILSFTADEIWQSIPGERTDTVFVAEWAALPRLPEDAALSESYWQQIAAVKTAVNKVLETKKSEGIQKSLEASITLYADGELQKNLQQLGDELRFVLICSGTQVKSLSDAANADETELSGLKMSVSKIDAEKCERCWHHREDVGSHAGHETICGRCVDNVAGDGESRQYA